MRLRLDLAYDGSGYHGWARQPGLRTVQGELERGLTTVLRVDRAEVTVAGRTDTGVHARGQVAHVDVAEDALAAVVGRGTDAPVDALLRRLNGVLDADVRVRSVAPAPPGFDARFSAIWRRYVYRVADRVTLVDPLVRGHVLAWPRPLDEAVMAEASRELLGEHDFAAFCRKREGATTIRTLLDLTWARREDGPGAGTLEATVRADAFCHSMVRALVGCLLAVGDGRRPPEWAAEVLAGRRRDPAVTVAHAHGLTLEEVAYPADADLASRARTSRALRTLPPTTPA
ncbi:tRNA pseudouridine(38-40) synthase TruA [Nocardioides aurantiacus]|uniref:tRNA pseudouridine synthase A n=1 Tax=Nocardioides aurantiacus TaxID=86796 RepID=A0A3N2CQ53_9ACTN|nr:tRNA pseudouridine(38-40) synthase TruA [Nocardioides aurantiacus]ROR89650.1 tRNA pseudouridine(38-40) synthase [Nocardioides aurantiacus]